MMSINPTLTVPESELRFTFTTSGGPGGQNVNKVATKAVLQFDVARSSFLDQLQRERIRHALGARINNEGVLRIACSRERSQVANRRGAIVLFTRLLADALRPRKKRRKTRPTRTSIERRRATKTVRSRVKRQRRTPFDSE